MVYVMIVFAKNVNKKKYHKRDLNFVHLVYQSLAKNVNKLNIEMESHIVNFAHANIAKII